MARTGRNTRGLTLEQIGERAGVSRSTVSRVLNDHPDVRPDVRTRVEQVIRETGYHPNPAARALVSNRSGLIGLVMLTEVDELFGDPYYSALVRGIQEGCAANGLTFAIFPVPGPDGSSDALTPQIAQGMVDGVIVTAGPRSERVIAALRRRGAHMTVVGHPEDDSDLVRVDVDHRAGGSLAVAHLHEHGRRRIGFVGPTREHRYGNERLDGYREGIERAGLPFDDALIRREHPNEAGGYRAALALLDARPDAIFVATDPMAAGAYRAITERGLRIPDDVAVVGFDGLDRRPVLDPPLTTIVQPVPDVGRTAVELLAADTDDPRVVILPTALRVGASCGDHDVHVVSDTT